MEEQGEIALLPQKESMLVTGRVKVFASFDSFDAPKVEAIVYLKHFWIAPMYRYVLYPVHKLMFGKMLAPIAAACRDEKAKSE